jgi:hypothetical protein
MTLFHKALAVVASAALIACGSAPVSLSGRILDQKGSAVQKAEVFTEPETDVVMTNNRGFFTLKQRLDESGVSQQIPAGVYKIKVRKFGFEDAAFEVTIEGGPTKVPDITLAPRTPDINETAPDTTQEKEFDNDTTSTPVLGN